MKNEIRYQVIADYPEPKDYPYYKVGTVLKALTKKAEHYFDQYPTLFKLLAWYEERSIEELTSVKSVEITHYVGYWRVGDIVPVSDYKIDYSGTKPKFLAYVLKYKHSQHPSTVIPATEKKPI